MLSRLYRSMFEWRFEQPSMDELQKADAIVVQAYSRSRHGDGPGRANYILAYTAFDMWEAFKLPVLSMTEIQMTRKDPPTKFVYKGQTGGHSTQDCNTFTIAQAHAKFCAERGYKTVIVVASEPQMGRALWCYERLGLATIPMPVEIRQCLSSNYLHWSHRGVMRFAVREFCVRLMFLAKGHI